MTAEVILIGRLADPAMRAALGLGDGRGVAVPGALQGGALAGIEAGGWPLFDATAAGQINGCAVARNAALDRYAAIMGLTPVMTASGPVLGAVTAEEAGGGGPATAEGQAFGALPDATGLAAQPDATLACPPEADTALAASIAADLVALPVDRDLAQLRARLPMIAVWAASRRRARMDAETGAVAGAGAAAGVGPAPRAGGPRVRIAARDQVYADYFSVEKLRLSHLLHETGDETGDHAARWSPPLDRAVFVSGDAVVVLPWDMRRDRVLVLDQFRPGPAARDDPAAWLLEPVAGRIDAGETPESSALRETIEEAGVTLTRLIGVPGHYPSPGAVAEYLYCFIGLADLPDGSAGLGGLESEGEDIRSRLMPRAELTRLALTGGIRNGPLMILALWLDRMAATLAADEGPTRGM